VCATASVLPLGKGRFQAVLLFIDIKCVGVVAWHGAQTHGVGKGAGMRWQRGGGVL